MRALLDINLLLALHDKLHVHHERARHWLAAEKTSGWASCPLTENGYLRISSQPNYPAKLTVQGAHTRLMASIAQSDHAFWPDDVSLLDTTVVEPARLLGPNQITDIYLLALAVKNGGRLVTFDRTVPIAAVRGARAENLIVL